MQRSLIKLLLFRMPFYAVARGRTPGIFKTWYVKNQRWWQSNKSTCKLSKRSRCNTIESTDLLYWCFMCGFLFICVDFCFFCWRFLGRFPCKRAECETQVKGFTGAVFKKFSTDTEAKLFILEKTVSSSSTSAVSRKIINDFRVFAMTIKLDLHWVNAFILAD